MANKPEEAAETTHESASAEPRAIYIGDSDVRILTSAELSALGVTHKEDLRWDKANGKSVVLSKTNLEALVKSLPREFAAA